MNSEDSPTRRHLNGNIAVSKPYPTVDEILDENLSPLSYHQRAQDFLPLQEEQGVLSHYFVS
jgi:hypothetical protein